MVRIFRPLCLLAVSFFLLSAPAGAQTGKEELEPAAVVEIGGVPSWSFTDHEPAFGPTVAAEFTPIKNWLEIELPVEP